jgi:CubicO group peptidase (beta-lactamase class C family)
MLCCIASGGSVKRLAAAVLLVVALALLARARPRNETMEKKLDALFTGVAAPDAPGLAVLVKKDGKVAFEHGYGVRDLRSHERTDARTNFRLASLTKQFTAMAIMLLVHDEKLHYDDTLSQILPEFPAYGRTITIRNLLNHTSGLPDYEDLMAAEEKVKGTNLWSPEKQIHDDEALALLEKTAAPKFAPGTKWEYSNSGYVVLGLIIAKVSGEPFADFLRKQIFAPLKMEHTLVFERGKGEIPNRAYGHSKRGIDNTFLETDQSSTSATQGDGGIYSNLEDLSKWDDALRNHTLLSQAEFQAALAPPQLPAGAETKLAEDAPVSMRDRVVSYGFGWFLDFRWPHPLIWHYGDTMGFKTAIQRYTRDNLTIIILCNRNDLDPSALAQKAADLFLQN